jgi:drug/metabolite transporter (DMT)-like permease
MSQNIKAHLLVVLATFVIASSFIISKKLSGIIDPISINLYRFLFASLLLIPFVVLKKTYRLKIKKSFKKGLIISLFYSLYFIGFFKALEFTTALNTGTIYTLLPFLTAIFAIFIFKQKITKTQVLIYLIGIVGTLIVIFKGDITLFLSMSLNKGDIIYLFAIISMVLYSVSAKYLYEEGDIVIVVTLTTLIGGAVWMGLSLFVLEIPLEWGKIKGVLFWYMSYLVVITFVSVYLYQKATIILGPKKVMAYVYLSPAVIALLSFVFEGINIPFVSIVGIFISAAATLTLLLKS